MIDREKYACLIRKLHGHELARFVRDTTDDILERKLADDILSRHELQQALLELLRDVAQS